MQHFVEKRKPNYGLWRIGKNTLFSTTLPRVVNDTFKQYRDRDMLLDQNREIDTDVATDTQGKTKMKKTQR